MILLLEIQLVQVEEHIGAMASPLLVPHNG
jgi:hypothetical protein